MANVYSIALTVLGVVVAHCCLLVWTALILPGPVERSRRRIETRPISSFLIGLVCCLITIGLIAGFSVIRIRIVPRTDNLLEYLSVHLQFTRFHDDAWILTNGLVWLLAAPVLASLIFGGAGFAQLFSISARAMMRNDRPLLGLTYGALCTSASYFLPLVGWFIFLPIVGLISIGAGICGILGAVRDSRRRASRRRRSPPRTNHVESMTRLSRRQFGQWTALAVGVVSLGGCAPWEKADPQHGLDRLTDEPTPTPLEWRVHNRLGYGPRPGDVARMRAQGVDAWIDEQLHPESIAESPDLESALAQLDTLNMSPEEARDREMDWEPETAVSPLMQKVLKVGKRHEPKPGLARQELVQATVLRAAFSPRTLQEVLVEFWSDHFSINQAKGDCRWLKTADDREMRPHALGHFRDLLGASAHSPAMLFNLDNIENRKSSDGLGPHFNENYARELLELHTLGDTTAYSLRDIQEVARVLSGWTMGEAGSSSEGQFIFRADDHDDGEKVVLGIRFAAGQGRRDGEQLLDLLAGHPLTARHVSTKLCDRFLGSVPTGLRDRLAAIYLRTQGEIQQLVGELARSEEFRGDISGSGSQPVFKRPFQYAISAMRMLGARTSGAKIIPYLETMGQRPFAWLQPNGFPLRPNFWSAGLLAGWQFAIDLVRNKIGETWINLGALERATRGSEPADVCRRLSQGLLTAPLAESDLDALAALSENAADASPHDGLSQCLALLLMSPQFQWC